MTRLNPETARARKPDTVAISELSLAAGIAGRSIAICLTESPAEVDCELFQYLTTLVGAANTLHVHGQADLKKLNESPAKWRLVILHAERLFEKIAWMVQSAGNAPRPAIFMRFVPGKADDAPIPLLTLRGTTNESAAIVRWLMSTALPANQHRRRQSAVDVSIPPSIIPVTIPRLLPGGHGPETLRDCQLIAALLVGASLIRNDTDSDSSPYPITCSEHDYETVRRLLNSSGVATSQDSVDQLAIEMVQRANVYLRLKSDPMFGHEFPRCLPRDNSQHSHRQRTACPELVTRREIADLGNVRGALINAIITSLQRRPKGDGLFQRMGLIRPLPADTSFTRASTRNLVSLLRPWTAKQVRTHFHNLHKSGLVTGEREANNAAWQYRLPEELNDTGSPFAALPSFAEMSPEHTAPGIQ